MAVSAASSAARVKRLPYTRFHSYGQVKVIYQLERKHFLDIYLNLFLNPSNLKKESRAADGRRRIEAREKGWMEHFNLTISNKGLHSTITIIYLEKLFLETVKQKFPQI